MSGPLNGVRIIDMTSVIMGPYATQILGDYGADIIKVESPTGDTTRQVPPMRTEGMGAFYLHINRNKRSIVLDLKKPAGIEALLKLAATADVLTFNVRPSAMERLGLTYERLCEVNPQIIVVCMVGFGQDGPYAKNPAYEDLIQGLTSIPSMLVDAGSETPHYVPLSFSDRAVGLNAAIAIVSALFHRQSTGEGQYIEVPMFETMVQSVYSDHMGGLTFEPPIGGPGYKRQLNKNRRPYKTKDGYICVIVYTNQHWQRFAEIIDKPRLLKDDSRFKDITSRTEYASEVYELIDAEMKNRTTAEWKSLLEKADIPVAVMHTLETLLEDTHLQTTGFFKVVDHPTEGLVREMSIPTRWSKSTPEIRRHAPKLGEQSVEILQELGLDTNDINRMLEDGSTLKYDLGKCTS